MFIEPQIKGERRGWIEVICGSMFSGKTEELIRRLKRAKIANMKVEIFKPAIDVRYDEVKIVSHDTNAIQSTPLDNSQKILLISLSALHHGNGILVMATVQQFRAPHTFMLQQDPIV